MKITIQNKTLLGAVKQLLPICPKSSFLPILENLHIRALEGGALHITASDSELTATLCINGGFPTVIMGETLLNAKKLAEILSALPPDAPVCIACNQQEHTATITTGKNASAAYKMPVDDVTLYPAARHLEQEVFENPFMNMPVAILKKGLAATVYATGKDELRPAMTGVCLQFTGNKTVMVATDGFKLSLFEAFGIGTKTDAQLVLPAKAAQAVLRIDAPATEEDSFAQLSFAKGTNHLCLQSGNLYLSSVLIDGRFPDYRAVIPTENPVEILLHKSDLAEGIKRACLFTNKTTFEVCLSTIEQDALRIAAQDYDMGLQSEEKIPCDTNTPTAFEIALNGKILLDCLTAAADAPEIMLHCSQPHRAILITTPPGAQIEETKVTTLLMPIMRR